MAKINLLGLCVLVSAATFAAAQEHGVGQFQANLKGYNEVPSVLTTGSGQVTVAVASNQDSLSITLNLTKLVGTAPSAGLYLATPGTTGGLIAPICGASPLPACSTDSSTTATITSSDVAAIAAQGLAKGDLASVIEAIENGAVYVNVNSSAFSNGEIRGQLGPAFGFGFGIGNGSAR